MKSYLFTAAISLFVVGCTTTRVTTDVTPLRNNPLQPRPSNCDLQLLSQVPVDKKYEELAIITAITDSGTFSLRTLGTMLPSIKAKACELGADAIVIKNVDLGGTPMESGGFTPSKAFCVAIKFPGAKNLP